MRIEQLTEANVEAAWRLRLSGFRDAPTAFGRSEEEERARSSANLRRMLGAPPDSFMLGAFDADGIVGLVGLERFEGRKRAHRAKLWGMYVDPRARGRGVGRKLVEELISRARLVAGLEQILLSVIADNAPAVALYRSLGFVAYALEPAAMRTDTTVHDELSMVLGLGSAAPSGPGGARPSPVPVTRGLTHLALSVADPERSARFYAAAFGAREYFRDEDTIQVQGPGPFDVLAFERRPGAAGVRGGVDHFGFRLVAPQDLDAVIAAVERAGGRLLRRGERSPGSPFAYVADPDGHEIELWFE